MTDAPTLSRRLFLGAASSFALLPGMAIAQAGRTDFPAFAAACRSLSGFDALPRPLVAAVHGVYSAESKAALVEGSASDAAAKSLLKTLYTGVHTPAASVPQRLAYADALMYAAIEDSVNVPSFCGGAPGYWTQKPVGA
jgi:hypothetical protein